MLMYSMYTLPCMDAQMPWAQDAQERLLYAKPFIYRAPCPRVLIEFIEAPLI